MSNNEPIFEQVVSDESVSDLAYNALRTQFENGQFSPGQKLPSEPELSKQLNISRMTLRTALQKLVLQGYIEVKRGVGTFFIGLPRQTFDTGIERLESISNIMRERGHKPGTKSLEILASEADEHVASDLNIKVGDPITIVNRVRTKDDVPLIYDNSIFPSFILPQDTDPNEIGESLFAYIENIKNLKVNHAIARLVPALADEYLAEKLEINKDSLLIQLQQTHYLLEKDAPVWLCTLSIPKSDFSWFIIRTR
jgi:GntR family transcriptional regulator